MADAFLHRRFDYDFSDLEAESMSRHPMAQLASWLAAAGDAGNPEPNAFVLATATPDGLPSARVLLLRGLDSARLCFYTNYESRKGQEIKANPVAAICFYWPEIGRQVRVEGSIEKMSELESDNYFGSRPFESQLASIASPQSKVIHSLSEVQERIEALRSQSVPLQRPQHWGGYQLFPKEFEFWQGRPARLHDRFRYRLAGDDWMIERLGS